MCMSRKHFEIVARAIKDARPLRKGSTDISVVVIAGHHAALDNAADFLADAFQAENPRFDRARFLAACGVQS